MGKHTSQFQKGKYTELKALLMMMTEFYIYSGHDPEWILPAGQLSLLLEEEALIFEPGWVQHESGHLIFHFFNGI